MHFKERTHYGDSNLKKKKQKKKKTFLYFFCIIKVIWRNLVVFNCVFMLIKLRWTHFHSCQSIKNWTSTELRFIFNCNTTIMKKVSEQNYLLLRFMAIWRIYFSFQTSWNSHQWLTPVSKQVKMPGANCIYAIKSRKSCLYEWQVYKFWGQNEWHVKFWWMKMTAKTARTPVYFIVYSKIALFCSPLIGIQWLKAY